jgi:DNA repair photolyase
MQLDTRRIKDETSLVAASPSPTLVGIARLAASGDLLDAKKNVEYRTLPTRSWLNRCHSDRVPFDWTINPYRGCEYACRYCYARFTHEFLERRDPSSFETEIFAKVWDRLAFFRELRKVSPGQTIALGTATDPYQPAERRYGLTRHVLEELTCLKGIRLCVTTKSDLVARDTDLLARLAQANQVHVSVSVTTLDASLARLIEPMAPRPDLRLLAVSRLRKSTVHAGVIACPVLPCITDTRENLAGVARAAKLAGATHFGASLLFLQGGTKTTYFEFLRQRFPALVPRYQAAYGKEARLTGRYADRLERVVEGIREEAGIDNRDFYFSRNAAESPPQLTLF